MEKHKVLDQLLMELHRFLLILDKETLSGNATIQKGLISDLLHSYRASNGYNLIQRKDIQFNGKKIKNFTAAQQQIPITGYDDRSDVLLNGKGAKCVPVPQKSLPDLPPPRTRRTISETDLFCLDIDEECGLNEH
ncbi:hypothetical protein F2P81_022334 [Scophthalmus maximus]|uniref:Uncharacterized protein n=1 Tax=Scophthalmus maximus TaxID=52904 RepID=A0A6A4RU00_SCOMX|nr:hypothetical protein F2P81_022334 [Scophthalmus maximus]